MFALIGVTPATTFLKDTGVEMDTHGFITVDKVCVINIDAIYNLKLVFELMLHIFIQ